MTDDLSGARERPKPTQNDVDDWVCEHGTAMDVHCCNCHSGYLFDLSSCVCGFEEDDDV